VIKNYGDISVFFILIHWIIYTEIMENGHWEELMPSGYKKSFTLWFSL